MDPRYQDNAAPQQQPQAIAAAQQPQAFQPAPQQFVSPTAARPQVKKQSWKDRIFHPNNTSKVIAISVVGAALVVAASSGIQTFQNGRVNAAEAEVVERDKYQAVFLTNGQVYFGKIDDVNSSFVRLSDIYYLQQSEAQADKTKAQQAATSPESQANMSLAKLGNELHAPEDAMYINKDEVLFWENLKKDGKVSTAIAEDKKKK